jgi:uncharacterized protein YgiM (DUF1202 family)
MKTLAMILILILASLACMTTTIPGGTFTAEENDQVTCIEPMCQLAPTQTAIAAAGTAETSEPAAGEVFEIPTPGPLCARVTAIQSLHLRAQPNEQARVLAYLDNGEQVRVIAFGKWWKIDTTKGEGFSNAKYLELTECQP